MKAYQIVHDMPGRMRIRYGKYTFSKTAAIGLSYELERWKMVNKVEANDITGSILFIYDKNRRRELLALIRQFEIEKFDVTPYLATIKEYNSYEITQKEVSQNYTSKFIKLLLRRYSIRWFLPTPIQYLSSIVLAVKYFKKGLASLGKGHIDVPVLDATSIAVSMLNRQFKTAGDIMFLLSVSQLLEDYTRKKTTLQLKESLSLHLDKVWILENESEIEIPSDTLKRGDIVIVHMGTMIPVDGEITDGQALINESSFTGEPLSKAVGKDDTVFAGTIVEEGKIYVKVRNLQKESRINKIVDMIDVNETLKAGVQSRAEHLADSIVPFSFFGFFGLLLWTRSLTRATSILLVDYSCAIKLTTSISIISAMQEAGKHSIMVKGGKYLEAMAQADTIVFDKTGTLTNATPFVQEVTPLDDYSRDEVLRIAACLEEHFPHRNRVSCQGLSQWGSKYLGDQGYSAIEIIRYYYGNDMYINAAQAISGVPSSWPGYDLTIGASGPKVRQIQEQLNRIAQNYPAIPKTSADGIFGPQTAAQVRAFQRIFNLPATGIVDYPTWYQISNIYVAVSRIAEPGT